MHTLREQCTALEAAIELVMVKPRKKPVHQLRTSTRRIEAQLQLLCLLEPTESSLKDFSNTTRKLTRLLAGVRKAAGKVRDLDVQRDLVRETIENGAKGEFGKDAKQLRRSLKAERTSEAEALLDELEGHARKLGPKLENMLKRLEPAVDLSLSSTKLTRLIRSWYTAQTASADESEESLHNIRKAAKLARYMAESGDNESLAKSFEDTQQLGGAWHDALTLRQVAHDQLGKKSRFSQIVSEQERTALDQFQQHLETSH